MIEVAKIRRQDGGRAGCAAWIGGAAGCLALVLLLSPGPAAAETVTQGQWARMIVEAMGISEEVAPGKPRVEDLVDFLSGSPGVTKTVWASTAAPFPGDAPRMPDPAYRGREWLRAGGESVRALYRVRIDHPGMYALRFRGDGGAQKWRVAKGAPRTAIPTKPEGAVQKDIREPLDLLGYFLLSRGEHEVSVEVPAAGGLLRFDFVRQPFPHVRPPAGWRPGAPLTFGDKAVTMIQAMELEHELPDISRWRVEREAENHDEVLLPAERADSGTDQKPSSGAFIRGVTRASRVAYALPVARTGTYSLLARVTGKGSGRFLLNDLVERAWRSPGSSDRLVWRTLATLPLDQGTHQIEVMLDPGAGFDVMRLIYRDPSPEASLMLLEDLGFDESKADELVSIEAARENIENKDFLGRVNDLLESFYSQPGPGIGPASGPSSIPPPGVVLTTPEPEAEIIPPDLTPPISP